ncbi:MAG: SBBP repeat-containing protein [Promethearchaeota archaeon]
MLTNTKRHISIAILTIVLCLTFSSTILYDERITETPRINCEKSPNFDPDGINLAQVESEQDILNQINSLSPQSASIMQEELNLSDVEFPGFTENKGQIPDGELKYYLTTDTYAIGFRESELNVFSRLTVNDTWEIITIRFPDSNSVIPDGKHKLSHITNFLNRQPTIVNVSSLAEIIYPELYPGISMRFYCQDQALKYDFLVSPGADPTRIHMEVQSSSPVTMEVTPTHVVCTSLAFPNLTLWEERKPVAYQENNAIVPVSFEHNVEDSLRYGFGVGDYDKMEMLVIDPIIFQLSTYLGGSEYDIGKAIAVDAAGYIYITGNTKSTDFPTQNAFDSTFNDSVFFNVFVTKFNPDGQTLNFSTYLRGSGSDHGNAIAVDAAGYIYITGETKSTDFPTQNAFDSTFSGGFNDVFVTKFNLDGQSLNFSTYLGGSGSDYGNAIAVDAAGYIYINGYTYSTDFPTYNAFDSTYNDDGDVFVTKFNLDGQILTFSTYLGGSSEDCGYGIAVDDAGYIYITGETGSTDFPAYNAFDSSHNGGYDVFITKFNPDGQSLNFNTYLGGSGYDCGNAIAVDEAGYIYITGETGSTNFPTHNAFDSTFNDGDSYDVFVTKFNPDGQILTFSTYVGGSEYDLGKAISVDAAGYIYITGYTYSTDFPTHNAYDSTINGGSDVFVVKMSQDSDGDGLADDVEINTYFTDPNDADSDDDELSDGLEVNTYLTDPNNPDTDADGMPDGWEINNSLNPLSEADAETDPDGDGLSNLQEYLLGTNPQKSDSDSDGFPDNRDPNPNSFFIPTGLIILIVSLGTLAIFGIYGIRKRKMAEKKKRNLEYERYIKNLSEIKPKTPEEAIELLNKLQIEVDKYLNLKQYSQALPLLKSKIRVYIFAIKLFRELGLETMIPPLESELTKHNALFYDTFHLIWAKEYDVLSQNLETQQKEEKFKAIVKAINKIVTHINKLINFLKEIEKEDEVNKYIKIKKQFFTMRIIARFTVQYKQMEHEYNDLMNMVKIGNYALAIAQSKQMKTEIMGKLTEFRKKAKKIPELTSLVNAIEDLLDGLERFYIILTEALSRNLESLSKNLKEAQMKENFREVNNIIEDLITKISIGIDFANEMKKEDDTEKFTQIKERYDTLRTINNLTEQYKRLEGRYNRLGYLVKQGKLTPALTESKQLRTDVEEMNTELRMKSGVIQNIASLENAANTLLERLDQFNLDITSNFQAQLRGISSTTIDLQELSPSITMQEIPKIQISPPIPLQEIPKIRISPPIPLPEIPMIRIKNVHIPLYAKIVLLGESSVGKTHLVLSITNVDYSPTQGSTVGVDKFYKPVKLPIEGYDPQLCFWDLGGQWNFRAINELFLNEAAVILLVFDMTRPETFAELEYWMEIVKTVRGSPDMNVIVIGNKIDVGGSAIPNSQIKAFLKENNLKRFYKTSAVTKQNIGVLLEDIAGAVDWSTLMKEVPPDVLAAVENELKHISKHTQIMKLVDLMSDLDQRLGAIDPIMLKAVLKKNAAQEIVQFGRSELFIILDIEMIDKAIATIIGTAAEANGMVSFDEIAGLKALRMLDQKQKKLVMDYLVQENVCYIVREDKWLFPHVLHRHESEITADRLTLDILNSGPISGSIKFRGPGDLIFSRFTVVVAQELGIPEEVSNITTMWKFGRGHNKTAVMGQFIPSSQGGVIRIKAGGGQGTIQYTKIMEILRNILSTYASQFADI